MGKELAGVLFVYFGNKYDYCYLEAIECLLECTDHVYVVAGGDDGTLDNINDRYKGNPNITIIPITKEEWEAQKGREKLNWFTNIGIIAAEKEGYEWQFNLQADEILIPQSYNDIRKAIKDNSEGFMCTRVNLWKDPYHQLNVVQERKPCSTRIIRLSKTKYRSVDDAENIEVPLVNTYYEDGIIIYHYGFIRNKKIMKDKVIHIQEQVFLTNHDSKLDGIDYFEPDRWFDPKKDLKLIDLPHPKIMKEWISTRP